MVCVKKYYRVKKDGSLSAVEALPIDDICAPEETRFNAKTATSIQKEAWVYQTFERISGRYDLMNDLESFGLHRLWKRKLVKAVCALAPNDVLDVASGTGDIALGITRTRPQARVVALDFSQNMLDVARHRAEAALALSNSQNQVMEPVPDTSTILPTPSGLPTPPVTKTTPALQAPSITHTSPIPLASPAPTALSKLEFVQASALELPFPDESFDAVTISFGLRNMPDYQRSVGEMVRVLRPGGCFFCLEASYPTIPGIKQAFRLYFRYIMPAIADLVTGKRAEYQWLNDSTEAFLTKEQLVELMEQQGLCNARYRSLALGAAALHHGVKVDRGTVLLSTSDPGIDRGGRLSCPPLRSPVRLPERS